MIDIFLLPILGLKGGFLHLARYMFDVIHMHVPSVSTLFGYWRRRMLFWAQNGAEGAKVLAVVAGQNPVMEANSAVII